MKHREFLEEIRAKGNNEELTAAFEKGEFDEVDVHLGDVTELSAMEALLDIFRKIQEL